MPEATTAMLSHEASMAMSRLKSSYFSTTAAHAVLEEDPDTHINAAESFLGRRVFRLLQSSSKSSTVSQQSQQGGEARRAGKPTASRAAATEMMIDLGDAAYNKAMTQSMEVASEGNSDGSGSSSSSGGSAPTSARDFG